MSCSRELHLQSGEFVDLKALYILPKKVREIELYWRGTEKEERAHRWFWFEIVIFFSRFDQVHLKATVLCANRKQKNDIRLAGSEKFYYLSLN